MAAMRSSSAARAISSLPMRLRTSSSRRPCSSTRAWKRGFSATLRPLRRLRRLADRLAQGGERDGAGMDLADVLAQELGQARAHRDGAVDALVGALAVGPDLDQVADALVFAPQLAGGG